MNPLEIAQLVGMFVTTAFGVLAQIIIKRRSKSKRHVRRAPEGRHESGGHGTQ